LERCETDTVRYCRQLLDSLYDVKETVDVEYARANGFWSSYPDEDKPFSAIYTERLPQLADTNVIPLCMDIYEPEDHSDAMRPLIVLIHGGAFYNGDKQDETYVKWCRHYASLGYVAVSVNYRMGFLPYKNAIDCAGYRATQDVNAAIRYLLHHADTYRINPDWIFTWGTSAGGITALNVAFMKDGNRPKSVLQEGKIAKLNPKFTETFKIKAVANMWGTVHDTNILANSRIPVISFHGDADGIVPYGFGLPFKNMMSTFLSYQLEDQLSRLLSPSSNEWRSLLEVGFPMIYSGTEQWKERVMQPIWDKIVSPMYGSACIHEYLDRHGVRNKLFTVAGADQHSLHVDEHRNIVPYFYTIQDSVAQFFYAEMVPKPVNLHQESAGSPFFRIDNTDAAEIHWQVEGGVLLEKSDSRAKVMFFGDAKRHVVRVSGRYKNGIAFNEEIPTV
jgi:dienelactone hydrolase